MARKMRALLRPRRRPSAVRIRVPPNTTMFGLGADATLVRRWLDIAGPESGSRAMNVIIRNLTFLDTADCFPEWSPNDGAHRQLEFRL